jgi:ABC-type oligopeptide transport system substrate-binding subunit
MTAKYPALRKAIMAAIDYHSFLDVITDSAMIMDKDNICLNSAFDTTQKWRDADYYGEFDQAVVDKYLDEARAQGYADEPIQLVYHTGRTDVPTMIAATMERAGINTVNTPTSR